MSEPVTQSAAAMALRLCSIKQDRDELAATVERYREAAETFRDVGNFDHIRNNGDDPDGHTYGRVTRARAIMDAKSGDACNP